MTKEIRKEKDWLGNEKEVIYEDGEKTGEIRNEKTFFGTDVKREYNNEDERVNETRSERTFWGTPVERTYNTDNERISETRHERTFFGSPVDRTYNTDDELIAETRREKTFFGTPIKRVYPRTGPATQPADASTGSYSSGSYDHSSRGSKADSHSSGKFWGGLFGGVIVFILIYQFLNGNPSPGPDISSPVTNPILPSGGKPVPFNSDAPLETGVVATCAEVHAWKDYVPKQEFHPGEALCAYVEALNVNQGGRVDVSFVTKIQDNSGVAIAQKDGEYSAQTTAPHIWHFEMVPLPQYLSPGMYTAVVEMRNNLTGQFGTGSTRFVVPAASQLVQSGSQLTTINVPANQEWTNTGLMVFEGNKIHISATGSTHPCKYNNCLDKRYQQWIGPEGFVNLPRLQPNSLPDMALIAKMGTWGPIYIGPETSFVAQASGNLYLGVNDAPDNLSDNAGSFAATIRMEKSASETAVPSLPSEVTDQSQANSKPSPAEPPSQPLQPIDCREEENFRSKQAVTPSAIEFVNNTDAEVHIHWLNQGGKRVFFRALSPSEGYVQSTFLTHPWVVADSRDHCLGIFLPDYGTRKASVRMSR